MLVLRYAEDARNEMLAVVEVRDEVGDWRWAFTDGVRVREGLGKGDEGDEE